MNDKIVAVQKLAKNESCSDISPSFKAFRSKSYTMKDYLDEDNKMERMKKLYQISKTNQPDILDYVFSVPTTKQKFSILKKTTEPFLKAMKSVLKVNQKEKLELCNQVDECLKNSNIISQRIFKFNDKINELLQKKNSLDLENIKKDVKKVFPIENKNRVFRLERKSGLVRISSEMQINVHVQEQTSKRGILRKANTQMKVE